MNKYKLEYWRKTLYKGQKNEKIVNYPVLVKRGKNGYFEKGTPIIKEIREKTYGSGVYIVGVYEGKIITRKRIFRIDENWKREHKEEIEQRKKSRQIYRTSYALNDIPFRGNVYYGFRIIAFSNNKILLNNIKDKLKERLIQFIEDCLHYDREEFWFSLYWGYESPVLCNAYMNDNNKFYLSWQKRYGEIKKEEMHNLREII